MRVTKNGIIFIIISLKTSVNLVEFEKQVSRLSITERKS